MARTKVERVATMPLIAERPTVPETKLPLFRVATAINERPATVALAYKQLAQLMALGTSHKKGLDGLADLSQAATKLLYAEKDAYTRVVIVALAQNWSSIARHASDPVFRLSSTPDLVTRLEIAAAIKAELGETFAVLGKTFPIETLIDDVWATIARLTAELDGDG